MRCSPGIGRPRLDRLLHATESKSGPGHVEDNVMPNADALCEVVHASVAPAPIRAPDRRRLRWAFWRPIHFGARQRDQKGTAPPSPGLCKLAGVLLPHR